MEKLLLKLREDDEAVAADVASNVGIIWTLPRPAADRAIAIMRSPKLRAWITKPQSSALFVNGNQVLASQEYSTSFVSARLVHSIQSTQAETRKKRDATLVTSFFCAKHVRSKDPDGGPTGMMRRAAPLRLSWIRSRPHQATASHGLRRHSRSLRYV